MRDFNLILWFLLGPKLYWEGVRAQRDTEELLKEFEND